MLRMQVAGTACAMGPWAAAVPVSEPSVDVGIQARRAASSLAGGRVPRVFLESGGRACKAPGRPGMSRCPDSAGLRAHASQEPSAAPAEAKSGPQLSTPGSLFLSCSDRVEGAAGALACALSPHPALLSWCRVVSPPGTPCVLRHGRVHSQLSSVVCSRGVLAPSVFAGCRLPRAS